MPIRRAYPRETDWITVALAQRTRRILEERKWTVTQLASRVGLRRENLSKYLHPESNGYARWPVPLRVAVATAFGMTDREFLGDLLQKPKTSAKDVLADTKGIWDPAQDGADKVLGAFGKHEERATRGLSFFRLPPCSILPPAMSLRMRKTSSACTANWAYEWSRFGRKSRRTIVTVISGTGGRVPSN